MMIKLNERKDGHSNIVLFFWYWIASFQRTRISAFLLLPSGQIIHTNCGQLCGEGEV